MEYRRVSYVVAQEHWGYELASEIWRRFTRLDNVVLVTDEEHRQLMAAHSVEEAEELVCTVVGRSEDDALQSLRVVQKEKDGSDD